MITGNTIGQMCSFVQYDQEKIKVSYCTDTIRGHFIIYLFIFLSFVSLLFYLLSSFTPRLHVVSRGIAHSTQRHWVFSQVHVVFAHNNIKTYKKNYVTI